jgi:Flp pilus assembly pilin Flp
VVIHRPDLVSATHRRVRRFTPSENDLMDKLRTKANEVAARVARSRPATWPSDLLGPRAELGPAEQGQGLAEYALILAGIAIVAIASLIFLGGNISDLFWAPINEEFGNILSMLGI